MGEGVGSMKEGVEDLCLLLTPSSLVEEHGFLINPAHLGAISLDIIQFVNIYPLDAFGQDISRHVGVLAIPQGDHPPEVFLLN